MRLGAAGVCLFLVASVAVAGAQAPAQNTHDAAAKQAAASPDHASAYYHYMLAQRYKDLAGIYNRSDYVDRAITEFQKAIQDDPGSLFLRVQLAELYWRVSRIQDAVREIQAVVKENPDDVQAHRLLGRIYLSSLGNSGAGGASREMLEKTTAEFEAVHRLDPSDARSALMLGRLYKLDNKPQKAEALFEKVLSDNPDSRNVLVNLTQLYFDQGDYNKIISLLENIPDSRMDPALLYLLGSSYAQKRDFNKAEDTFKKALTREPDSDGSGQDAGCAGTAAGDRQVRSAVSHVVRAAGPVGPADGKF
jgi:tetratricopeptide (TPR) repeat protein